SIESDPRESGIRTRESVTPDRAVHGDARLRDQIDSVTQDRPTFTQFVERLKEHGIQAVPSVQKSGRLNGMSYEVNGTRIKGSDLGRGYTARGLEKRQRLIYDVSRDAARAKELAERARVRVIPHNKSLPLHRDRGERSRRVDGLTSSQRG